MHAIGPEYCPALTTPQEFPKPDNVNSDPTLGFAALRIRNSERGEMDLLD